MAETETPENENNEKAEKRPVSRSPLSVFSLFTFPGILVRQVAHQIFCRFLRVAIFDVRYLEPGGVVHEKPLWASHQILLAIGPFLLCSLLGALIAAPAAIPLVRLGTGGPLEGALLWLGFSLAVQGFPLPEEAGTLRRHVRDPHVLPVFRFAVLPIAGLIALGWPFWRRLVYGMVLTLLVPNALIWLVSLA